MNNTVYLSLGSNLGDRESNLKLAIKKLSAITKVTQISHIYETEPVGNVKQDDFLNMALQVKTEKDAPELLDSLHRIEQDLKRVRKIHWGPRTIDLDILFFNDEQINTTKLIIPHPEIPNRKFVLIPMLEITKDDFKIHQKINTLLEVTTDKNDVRIFNPGSEKIEH